MDVAPWCNKWTDKKVVCSIAASSLLFWNFFQKFCFLRMLSHRGAISGLAKKKHCVQLQNAHCSLKKPPKLKGVALLEPRRTTKKGNIFPLKISILSKIPKKLKS